jgi:hypothetical protein
MWRILPVSEDRRNVSVGVILLIVSGLFVYFNLTGPDPREDVALGVTFSYRYAEALGLDWKETYLAMLDDIGVRKLRIPVYWDLVEGERGTLDYSAVDWQLDEARKRGAEVVLSMGQRVPRWPECHIPGWVKDRESDDRIARRSCWGFFGSTVGAVQVDHPEIVTWQVENEPFLVFFGECPPLRIGFLDEEIALVRSLDSSRPIMLTDSGELSIWLPAAKRADIFGTTMYRKIYKPGFGYFTYPLGPNFFRFKEAFVRLFSDQDKFVVIELQAEPWANGWVGEVSVEEQFWTMNPDLLRQNVEYAKRVGFPEVYLWGVEWWYWLREKHDMPETWDVARELFRNQHENGTMGEIKNSGL